MRVYTRKDVNNSPTAMTPQQSEECRPERPVEYRVDDGVDGRGHVAQPQADVHHVLCNKSLLKPKRRCEIIFFCFIRGLVKVDHITPLG